MRSRWQPTLGAWPEQDGVCFRVWAPTVASLEVVPEGPRLGEAPVALTKTSDGYFAGRATGWRVGDRYRYRLDGRGPFPDPASRSQPVGVHGPSAVVDAQRFAWSDDQWRGLTTADVSIYELHVGTFTPAGDFAGVTERLGYLAELGVTAIELMPLADFPGRRNWGYDGVDLFAPANCYGQPDDLRQLVNEAHRAGLAVFLDVVYNHLGPDGNYLGQFSPYYFSPDRHTPWGASLNFGAEHSEPVRAFFIENALHWLHEYHLDGLRFDATHAMIDEGSRHILREMTERVRQSVPHRTVLLMAEDHRNLAAMVRPVEHEGWGWDAIWADDFHHQVRRCLAGDHEGYYRDYTGSTNDIALTMQKGWFFTGQHSAHWGGPRGTEPTGIPPGCFVICIQNHDQIGNRALGERLNHEIEPAAFRAASALLLAAPQTPLLFMGQEWASSSPFQFFTDHRSDLGRLVTEGRRNEFRDFTAFADARQRERIPDPQAPATFLASKLDWSEVGEEAHAAIHRLYRELLRLRRTVLGTSSRPHEATAPVEGAIVLRREGADGSAIVIVAALKPNLRVPSPILDGAGWELLFSTESELFCGVPNPPQIESAGPTPAIKFPVPAVLIFRKGTSINA